MSDEARESQNDMAKSHHKVATLLVVVGCMLILGANWMLMTWREVEAILLEALAAGCMMRAFFITHGWDRILSILGGLVAGAVIAFHTAGLISRLL